MFAILKRQEVFRAGLIPAFIAAIIGSVIIYNRNLIIVPDQNLGQVFAWQFVSWVPWVGIFPVIQWHLKNGEKSLFQWLVFSFLTAFGCAVWFILVSSLISPYLSQPLTMFGLYKWFLIFWFVLSFLLFWAKIGFYFIKTIGIKPLPLTSPGRDSNLLGIWQNGGHTVIKKADIIWIEAKDFYARIYLQTGEIYWVKMRLNQFMKILAEGNFVRAHRSAIINLSYLKKVDRIENQFWEAFLEKSHRIRLSRTGKANLEKAMKMIR